MRNAQDETLIIRYNELLTGHKVHVPRSHRAEAEFSVVKNTIGWFVALTILATLFTGAIIKNRPAETDGKPLSIGLAVEQPWTLYNPPVDSVGPPLPAPHPGPAPSFSLVTLIKPHPVPVVIPVPPAKHTAPAPAAPAHITVIGSGGKIQIVIAYALRQVGKLYVYNTAGPNTFDCSGLVLAAYAQIGIKMYHFTGAMLGYGTRVDRAGMRPGDLIFPTDHHVGIYLGNNKAVFAPHPGARVQIQTISSFYTARHITG